MKRTLTNTPLVAIGLALVLLALIMGPFPPDYENATSGVTVSHQERMTGQDKPAHLDTVDRRPGYFLYRILDGLVYLSLAQIIVATIALIRLNDRFFLLLLFFAGLYGAVYSVSLGLVIGPQIAFTGFSCIVIASGLDWITTAKDSKRINNGTHSLT